MAEIESKSPSKKWEWHVTTWLVPFLIAAIVLGVGIVAVMSGFEMTTLIVIVLLAWVLVLILVWIGGIGLVIKISASVFFTFLAGVLSYWVVKYDRPVLNPEIGGIVASIGPNDSLLFVEALISNSGRQTTYASNWRFQIVTDSLTLDGVQKFSQKRPEGAVDEPQLFDQEFPVGKPVRGWLYFAVHGATSDQMHAIFNCSTPPLHARSILSFTDTKEKHIWSQTRDISGLIKGACNPLPDVVAQSKPANTKPSKMPPTPSLSPQLPAISQRDCGVVQNGGVGNVASPNCAPQRKLSGKEHDDFVAVLRSSCPFKVAVRPINGSEESTKYAQQISQALTDAGCTPHDPVRMIDVANSYGVSLVFHDNESIPSSVQVLANACNAAKITWTPHNAPFVEVGEVYIMVGLDDSKPQ